MYFLLNDGINLLCHSDSLSCEGQEVLKMPSEPLCIRLLLNLTDVVAH